MNSISIHTSVANKSLKETVLTHIKNKLLMCVKTVYFKLLLSFFFIYLTYIKNKIILHNFT